MNKAFYSILRAGIILYISTLTAYSQSGNWQAQWLGLDHGPADTSLWTCYIKEIQINNFSKKAIAKIATDSKYWLWLNGKLVIKEGQLKRGPSPTDTYYDEVDLAPFLKKGKNTLFILSWYWGNQGFCHNNSGKAALIFECAALNVYSDKSWKAIRHPSFFVPGGIEANYRLPETNVGFDARKEIDFTAPAVNINTWKNVQEYGNPPVSPWGALIKREIPQWKNSGLLNYTNFKEIPGISHGGTVICKLPKNLSITPYLKIEAKAGDTIDMRTDNYKGGGEYNIRNVYVTKNGVQEFECLAYLNGHEVHYTIPKGIKIISLKYDESRYDTDPVGKFVCNDTFYNVLWQKALNTLNLNMRDALQDPDRERSQWWGDAVIDIGEIFYSCDLKAIPLIQKAIRNLVDWQRADGTLYSPVPEGNWELELPSQMLASIGRYGFGYYYQYTGDKELIKYVYPAVKRYLSIFKLGKNGLTIHRPGGWDWLDWGANIDTAVIENAWYYMALDEAIKMAVISGNQADIAGYKNIMTTIKTNYNTRLWTGSEYKSPDYKDSIDDRGNGLAVVAGLADSTRFPAIKKVLRNEFHASPYMEKYVLEALFLMKDPKAALERMKSRYSNMVLSKVTTLWEGWGIGPDGYGGGSYNHGWAGGPLTLLSQYAAGLSPAKPGYEAYQILPQPGNLTFIKTFCRTVKGDIAIDIKYIESKFSISGQTPISGTVGIPKIINNQNVKDIFINGAQVFKNRKIIGKDSYKSYSDSEDYYLFTMPKGNWLIEAK